MTGNGNGIDRVLWWIIKILLGLVLAAGSFWINSNFRSINNLESRAKLAESRLEQVGEKISHLETWIDMEGDKDKQFQAQIDYLRSELDRIKWWIGK